MESVPIPLSHKWKSVCFLLVYWLWLFFIFGYLQNSIVFTQRFLPRNPHRIEWLMLGYITGKIRHLWET